MLWGIGFGSTLSSYQIPIMGIDGKLEEEPLPLFLLQSQLGQIVMFNRYFGLQHYANLEADFGSNDYWKSTYVDLTYNLDLLVNLANTDSFGSGLIFGVGAGFKKSFFSLAGNEKDTSQFDWQAKINVGTRLIFGSRFALDFIFRIPLLENHTGYYYRNASNEQEFFKYKDYFSFAINFTLGRF